MPDVQEPADAQERPRVAAVVFQRAPVRAGAAPFVSRLHQVICGAGGAAGAWQWVCPGGATTGGVSALVAGAPGTLAAGAALGCAATRRDLLSGRQYGAARAPSVVRAWRRRPACRGHGRALRKAPNWGRLVCGRGGATRVVLLLADSVTGRLWPPLVAEREDQAAPWQHLFERARQAGLDWHGLRGVTRDGAQGLSAFLCQTLAWVQHQGASGTSDATWRASWRTRPPRPRPPRPPPVTWRKRSESRCGANWWPWCMA